MDGRTAATERADDERRVADRRFVSRRSSDGEEVARPSRDRRLERAVVAMALALFVAAGVLVALAG